MLCGKSLNNEVPPQVIQTCYGQVREENNFEEEMTKPQKNLAGTHFLSCSLALLQLDKSLFKLFLLALQTYCNILLLRFHVVLQLHYLQI
jgi:hypothetical protein